MKIEIERDVPFQEPPGKDMYTRAPDGPYTMPRKWPWPEMKPGDSISVPDRRTALSAYNSFNHHQKTRHCRFEPSWFVRMRAQPDGTYRLWLLDKNQ